MVDMSVRVGTVALQNPIMPASGTFSTELGQVIDLNRLGALVSKSVSREFRAGNPTPRIAELECGMINSIGLPTNGLAYFLEHQVPDYKRFSPPLVANITSQDPNDFAAMAREVSIPEIAAIELNISCPTRNAGAGASAVMVGYLTFRNPTGLVSLIDDLEAWCRCRGFAKVADLTGAMIDDPPRETYESAASPIR